MKKSLILFGVLTVFLISCEVHEIHPYADFLVDNRYIQPYETIGFTNISDRAVTYHWDFGDGTTTNIANPTHTYISEGYFDVALTVTSSDGHRDMATLSIEVFYTELEITVAEWNVFEVIEYIVPDAYVVLYESLDDWFYDENAVVWGEADLNGRISFIGLESINYFVWAEADDIAEYNDHYDNMPFYDNYLDSYLTTPVLVPFAFNQWIAWVIYYDAPYKTAKKRKSKYDLNKVKRRGKSYIVPEVESK